MSPEVAAGKEGARTYDYRKADIWAIGCIMGELSDG